MASLFFHIDCRVPNLQYYHKILIIKIIPYLLYIRARGNNENINSGMFLYRETIGI